MGLCRWRFVLSLLLGLCYVSKSLMKYHVIAAVSHDKVGSKELSEILVNAIVTLFNIFNLAPAF